MMKLSLLELTRIKNSYLSQIVLSVNLCDGCSDDSVSIIFTDEDCFTVTSALKSLSMIKAGYSIITDSGKDLSRRLGLLSSASQDLNNCKDSLSADNPVCPRIQEKREKNKDDHILKIQSIETVVKGDSISQSINENVNVNKIAGDISSTKDSSIIAKLLLNGVRCSILTNGSSESEGVKNAIRSAYIDTKLKISSEESAPRKKLKLTKESNDVVSGDYSLSVTEDINCCKCKMDNGQGAMLQCKGCGNWWHYHCAGLVVTDNSVYRSRYECLKCINTFMKHI